jgi:hypothetical protein
MSDQDSKPVHRIRYGAVCVAIWESQSADGTFHRFDLAFPSRSKTSHTRRSLIARVSPFRWQRVPMVEFIDVYAFTRA